MTPRITPFLLIAVVLGAGGLALLRSEEAHTAIALPEAPAPAEQIAANTARLPPNHPPIDPTSPHATGPVSAEESPALTWQTPAGWRSAPNPNAMRLATFRPVTDSSDAPEISVARAGGTTEANIQRWLAQFDDTGAESRKVTKVHGLDVTVVEVSGTYMGGSMMPGLQTLSHPGWTLVGAIVTTDGSPYFFKLLGPTTQVHAARGSFDALVASIGPR
ncbi:MAG TPA: hypothetical protein VGL81_24295 [Polyangiaceae bacterium]|jgi:hypothetical protein